MSGVEVAGAVLGIFQLLSHALKTSRFSERDRRQGLFIDLFLERLRLTEGLFKEIVRGWESSPPPDIDLRTIEDHLRNMMERLNFEESISETPPKLRLDSVYEAKPLLKEVELLITRLHQITVQRQVSQLESTTQSMHKILLAIAELFEYPAVVGADEQGTERHHNIEAMRARLHETLLANPWSHRSEDDPFCFTFVLLTANLDVSVEPARGRVKIDTGAEDNWISTRLLERASVTFTPDDSLGTFLGANRQPFKPLGRVSVTWYSDNEAQTQTSDFFVQENAPFDAILGGGWVLEECLNVFHKPVLPLFRMTMGPDEFNDLKKRQEATNASNDEVIALQRIEKRARRERERQEEAQSRALSRITSPATLTRRNSSSSLSTFPSFVTSRSTAGSSTPGIPAQGSATAGTELQVPGDNSKGKGKEGSNAATVP